MEGGARLVLCKWHTIGLWFELAFIQVKYSEFWHRRWKLRLLELLNKVWGLEGSIRFFLYVKEKIFS
jgi:hypothetical protein